ncbi:unnamed protein product [Withania somnifera]
MLIKWIKPSVDEIKLNANGRIIRDYQGNILHAYIINFGHGNSSMAGTKAMLYGLTWCADRGYSRVKTETDSLRMTKCISREWKIP